MKLTFKGTGYLPEYHGFSGAVRIDVRAGETVDIPDEKAKRLLADFPGVFVAAKDKDLKNAPNDKQIKGADATK